MSSLKPPLKPARLRKAVALILAGFICSGSGGFPTETNYGASPGSTFTFFSTAMADDGRGRGGGWGNGGGSGNSGGSWGSHGGDGGSGGGGGSGNGGGWGNSGGVNGGGGWGNGSGNGGGDGGEWGSHGGDGSGGNRGGGGSGGHGGGGGSGGRGSDNGRASYAPSSAGGSGSNSSSVSYDANRNMMKLDFKIGGGEHHDRLEFEHHRFESNPNRQEPGSHRRHEHECGAERNHDRYFHDHERRKFDHHLRDVMDGWKERDSIEVLNQSVNSIATSNSFALRNDTPVESTAKSLERTAPAQQRDRTVAGNTRFAIGDLAFIPNEVLAVGLDPASIKRAEALGFSADPQAIASKASDHIITRFTVPPGMDAVRGQDLLSRELPGHRFELNKVYRLYRAAVREDEPGIQDKDKPTTTPGDTSRCGADRCFAWQAIGWKETLARCARGLKVGVIDTDIDEAHPAFAGRTIHRFDFTPDGHGVPPNWHGTAVLSLLAGSPLGGTPGLIPDAEFFAGNIFFSDERGEMAADTLSLLKAFDWMKSFGVKLVNMSFSGPRDELVAEAIEKLSRKGIVFVAAAGNEGPTAAPSYPAAYPQVIAVTAVTKDLHNYRHANRGDHIDVAAPGVDIWTAMPGGRAGYHSGTSFAAPQVTAILAVEPRKTLQQDKADLLDSLPVIDLGQQGRDPVYGRGLLVAPSECTPPWETTASNE